LRGKALPAFGVLIVNYNSAEQLARTVQALADQTFRDFEAIVVDNQSSDRSFVIARAPVEGDDRFAFIDLDRNTGFAAGNNLAAARARGKWLALLNPDAAPAPDWLAQMICATKRHPNVAMFGSTQIDAQGPGRLDGTGDHYLAVGIPWRGGYRSPIGRLPPEREVFSPCAAACLIRADAFHAVNCFDERFFCYVEDVDLAFRLRLVGHRCIQVRDAVVHHVGGASSSGPASAFALKHGLRNITRCFVRCMPAPLFWLLFPLHVAALLFILAKSIARGESAPVQSALSGSLRTLPDVWTSRRLIQRRRSVPWTTIARALSWNPCAYLRHDP
jgi:N-acetylglucosaminyl-diphospho-decaprenol L-rhamnosyltransferase